MLNSSRKSLGIKKRLLGASIIFNGSASVFSCTVRELSEAGARLTMPSTLGVPDLFRIVIKPQEDNYFCEVTSRTDQELNMTFTKKVVTMPRAAKRLNLHSW